MVSPRDHLISMYTSITAAIPDTMAEKINTTGMSGDDHHGFAFTEPKMKPTYPCKRNAEGMPMRVISQPSRSSISSARLLMLLDPRVISRYRKRFHPEVDWDRSTMSRR